MTPVETKAAELMERDEELLLGDALELARILLKERRARERKTIEDFRAWLNTNCFCARDRGPRGRCGHCTAAFYAGEYIRLVLGETQ